MIRLGKNMKEGSRFFCGAAEGQAAVRTFSREIPGRVGLSGRGQQRPPNRSSCSSAALRHSAQARPVPNLAPHKKARSSLPRFLCC